MFLWRREETFIHKSLSLKSIIICDSTFHITNFATIIIDTAFFAGPRLTPIFAVFDLSLQRLVWITSILHHFTQ